MRIGAVFAALVAVFFSFHANAETRHVKCLYQIVCGNFDVILVAGQSNATSRGQSWRVPGGELTSPHIFQLGRGPWDYRIIPAKEPLQHAVTDGAEELVHGVGFALPFALAYERANISDRDILIIPAAKGGTSVIGDDAYWRPDGPGVQDVTARLDSALHKYRHSRLVAILWHHGESDLASDPVQYRDAVVSLLTGIRGRYDPSDEIPIILGELAQPLAREVPAAARMNETVREISSLIPNSAIARSGALGTNGNYNPDRFDRTHFNAAAQIEFGKRYFCGYMLIVEPDSDIARNPYCQKWAVTGNPKISWWGWLTATAAEN